MSAFVLIVCVLLGALVADGAHFGDLSVLKLPPALDYGVVSSVAAPRGWNGDSQIVLAGLLLFKPRVNNTVLLTAISDTKDFAWSGHQLTLPCTTESPGPQVLYYSASKALAICTKDSPSNPSTSVFDLAVEANSGELSIVRQTTTPGAYWVASILGGFLDVVNVWMFSGPLMQPTSMAVFNIPTFELSAPSSLDLLGGIPLGYSAAQPLQPASSEVLLMTTLSSSECTVSMLGLDGSLEHVLSRSTSFCAVFGMSSGYNLTALLFDPQEIDYYQANVIVAGSFLDADGQVFYGGNLTFSSSVSSLPLGFQKTSTSFLDFCFFNENGNLVSVVGIGTGISVHVTSETYGSSPQGPLVTAFDAYAYVVWPPAPLSQLQRIALL